MDRRGNISGRQMVTDRDIVSQLGTAGDAFFGGFGKLRAVQRRAIPPILAGENVFVASATASGKTEAIIAPLVARVQSRVPSGAQSVRLLVVAPTRALVNDLTSRISHPLARISVTCGRQTSDRREKNRVPFVLLTTPESLDSMLVRDVRLERGLAVDHLLSGVAAVFVDEAHLLDGSTRGDQLCWLLGRLRRVRRDGEGGLQICAGSATVGDPEGLADRLLGKESVVVRVEGRREIEVFETSSTPSWFGLESSTSISTVGEKLKMVPSEGFFDEASRLIWKALSTTDGSIRKMLVFVPTRHLADRLSTHLDHVLDRRQLTVLAHHGSLSKQFRERAEQTFATARDAVLVATTTLEVGIDIGDVDVVAIVGAPSGTRSLMQRIGRAGRRIGCTRVLVLPRTPVEKYAMASMLIAARDGTIESEGCGHRWSVVVQQVASFVAQNRPRGRRRLDVLKLASDVWGQSAVQTTGEIVDALVETERLVESRYRLALGEEWSDLFDVRGRGIHSNFSTVGGIPVVDAGSGVTVAHVSQMPAVDKGIALGGQRWDVQSSATGELLVKPASAGAAKEGFGYVSRSAPTGLEYATHVRRGGGLTDIDAPFIKLADEVIWLHFGGSAYQILLCDMVREIRPIGAFVGLAVSGRPPYDALKTIAMQRTILDEVIKSRFVELERVLSVGPYQRHLPEKCRHQVVADVLDVSAFCQWLETRRVWEMTRSDPRWCQMKNTISRRDGRS